MAWFTHATMTGVVLAAAETPTNETT